MMFEIRVINPYSSYMQSIPQIHLNFILIQIFLNFVMFYEFI
jgi:hypothetical protein